MSPERTNGESKNFGSIRDHSLYSIVRSQKLKKKERKLVIIEFIIDEFVKNEWWKHEFQRNSTAVIIIYP